MAVPVYSVGQVLGAADCNNWFLPVPVRKSNSQSVTSSTTLVDDNDLQVAVAANAEYAFDMLLGVTGATLGSGDIKITFTVPSGASVLWYATGYVSSAGSATASTIHAENTSGTTHSFGVDGTGLSPVWARGYVVTSSTSGTLKLRWAQNTSSGTATVVQALSNLVARRTG